MAGHRSYEEIANALLDSNSWGVDSVNTMEVTRTALIRDIAKSLRHISGVLKCGSFLGIPSTLARISRNTHKPRRKSAKKGAKR